MARALRLEFAGALYHVTSRGDRREDIYLNDDDRLLFLRLLEDVQQRYNWVLHAYCLMDNHYHLLIETPDGNLSKGMRQLNGVYTQRSNRLNNRVGHVFQGRYKAILVQKESYLLELSRYIVLNPVRAEMVRTAEQWPWSSYRATAGLTKPEYGLQPEWLLAVFNQSKHQAQKHYQEFIANGDRQPSPWQALRNQVYLGDDAFVETMLTYLDKDKDLSEIPQSQRRKKPLPLAEYFTDESRNSGILKAYASGGYSMKEIGGYVGLHYSRVSRIIGMAKGKT